MHARHSALVEHRQRPTVDLRQTFDLFSFFHRDRVLAAPFTENLHLLYVIHRRAQNTMRVHA